MKNLFLLICILANSFSSSAQPKQVLTGHVSELVKSLTPSGKLEGNTLLDLILGLPLQNEEKLAKFLKDIYNPTSENYRHFLSPAEFTEQFAPDKKGFDEVVNYARLNKLTIVTLPHNRAFVHIKATAQQVEKLFSVKLLKYLNPSTKLPFFSTDRDPLVRIGTRILHISGLDNIAESFPVTGHKTMVGSGPSGSYRGNDFRNAYASDVPLTGNGQVIGLISFSDFSDADMQAYQLVSGIPNVIIRRVYLNGLTQFTGPIPPPPPSGFDSEGEISLDIQMAMSMAPGASITVYGVPSSGSTAVVLNEIANPSQGEPFPHQISSSFATNYGSDSTIYKLFLQMAAQGQTFFAYSGDNGAYADNATASGPLPFPPGDYPYVTSVGGTVLTMNGNGVSYNSEMTWVGGGGGPSPWFSIENWQKAAVAGTNSGNKVMRNCPDVSMPATNIYNISHGGLIQTVAGTSASTPLWAGFMALVNEQATNWQTAGWIHQPCSLCHWLFGILP
jgi:subtilase family serine protease